MAVSLGYHVNHKERDNTTYASIPALNDDYDRDGNETDNTYESIQVHPQKSQVKPYKCVDLRKLIGQGRQCHDPNPRLFDLDANHNLKRQGHVNLLRGYKYEHWSSPGVSRSMIGKGTSDEQFYKNGRMDAKTRDKNVRNNKPGVENREFFEANRSMCSRNGEFFGRNLDLYDSKGELYGRNGDYSGSHSSGSGSASEMYGRDFGLVGSQQEVNDRPRDTKSEVYGINDTVYQQTNDAYNSVIDKHRKLLLKYGYDVTDSDYVPNDPLDDVNSDDVRSTCCDYGGNETDNTYESIHVMSGRLKLLYFDQEI
ncbi:hypothetical protein SNE40_010814 [Patella caerulea]|uniref:Uncharacterized protein n=1 Tax=Patella caerulea TaxID=87958 RepID=A0AAN8K1R3_PATCE